MRWKLLPGACLASTSVLAANLLQNPGFEQGHAGLPAAWATRPGETIEWSANSARSGDQGVRFADGSETAGISFEAVPVPARPGGDYTASAWFKTDDAGCRPGIYINFFNEFGERIHHVFNRLEDSTGEWTEVTVTTEAPDDVVEVNVSLYAYIGDVGTFDADDAVLSVEGGMPPGRNRVPRAEPGGKEMVEIGSRRELFVDGYLVDGLSGDASRRLHQPVFREVVLTFDRPWEGPYCGYVTALRDGDRIRLYYRGWPDLKKPDCVCVAESADGVHFERPALGLVDWEGSKENNIVWKGPGSHNFTPFIDTNPDAPADQRYKALASAGPGSSLVPFASADGLNWGMMQTEPVITDGAFDSQNLAFYDSVRGEYVALFRDFKDGFRWVKVSRSPDFISWSKPQWCEYGDAPKEHLYTNAALPYDRAPHIYIGFPCRFVPSRKKVSTHRESGINDGVLMSSRDGLHWDRWVEAFLRPAPDPLCWTDRNNYIAWGIIETSPRELSLYWSEHYRYPTYRLRRGTIRTDGFVSIHAGPEGGELLTRPFRFEGDSLHVNAATSAIGSCRFELCDADGNALDGVSYADCPPWFGNEIDATVSWKEDPDLSAYNGRPVRLRVLLKDADLYALRFASEQ